MSDLLRELWPTSLQRHAANLLGPDRALVIQGIRTYRHLLGTSALTVILTLGWIARRAMHAGEMIMLLIAGMILAPLMIMLFLWITDLKRLSSDHARLLLSGPFIALETIIATLVIMSLNLIMSPSSPLITVLGGLFGGLSYASGIYLKCVRTLLRDVPRPPRRNSVQILRTPSVNPNLQPATIPLRR